jgi:hypothetical protein
MKPIRAEMKIGWQCFVRISNKKSELNPLCRSGHKSRDTTEQQTRPRRNGVFYQLCAKNAVIQGLVN